ncbi:MAG: aminotransferase class I/II-fold pyridoxal phosphate-dependent enzyme [Peptococcaceae bacterium]|nr:aminotransferase class I/II-fold pyridoxal phosphate-dependent enzyme [Peptococcaceae bacterium]
MKTTRKLANLPPYLFAQIDATVATRRKGGQKILELSKSDPEHATPPDIVAELQLRASDAANHHYPDFDGILELRQAAVAWYRAKYGVNLDPDTQVLPLLGSKEGIVHICEAFIDSGDIALIPDPAFPSYRTGTLLAEGQVFPMPLLPANNYLPDFNRIPTDIARQAKLMFLNYPNNPTGAVASPEFFATAVKYARENDIILLHDHAYSQTTFNGYTSPSLLQTPGALDLGIEFFTFSKAFNMAGWRLGLALGNAAIIRGLKTIETHVNAGIFAPIQYAGAKALAMGPEHSFFHSMNTNYARRLAKVVEFFNRKGWQLKVPHGTVYAWVPCPRGYNSVDFTTLLLEEAGVAVSPGIGFGEQGDNHVRICVTYPDTEVEDALARIEQCLDKHALRP